MKRRIMIIAVICLFLMVATFAMSGCLASMATVTAGNLKSEAQKKAATEPLNDFSEMWDYKKENLTLGEYLESAFYEEDYVCFGISDTSMLYKRRFTDADSFCIYYHGEACGEYYGVLEISGGVPAERATAEKGKPSDWHDVVGQ